MHALAGPFAAAAVLLAVAGAPKVARPMPAVRALRSLRLPGSAPFVRALGAFEVVVGVGAVAAGGRLFALLVAVSYLAFTAFVGLALRRGGVLSSCGCFAKADTPPTVTHLVVNVAAAAVAVAVTVDPLGGLLPVLGGQPLAGAPFIALSGLCAWFAYLSLARLPALHATAPHGAPR